MSCVSAEDEVTGCNRGLAGGFSGGEALAQVLKEEEMHTGGDQKNRY